MRKSMAHEYESYNDYKFKVPTHPDGSEINFRLSEQDVEACMFLWKWKVSTTAAIRAAIYPKPTIKKVYERLYQLAEMEFIRSQASRCGQGTVWLLDENGFCFPKDRIASFRQFGYGCEHVGHDLLTVGHRPIPFWHKLHSFCYR